MVNYDMKRSILVQIEEIKEKKDAASSKPEESSPIECPMV